MSRPTVRVATCAAVALVLSAWIGPPLWASDAFGTTLEAAAQRHDATLVDEGPPYDGTEVAPGATFTKRWTVSNTGTTTWDPATYSVTQTDGTYGPTEILLAAAVAPGEIVGLTAEFTAPTTPGTHRATYQLSGPGGVFGDPFWVEVVVAGDGATFVDEGPEGYVFSDSSP